MFTGQYPTCINVQGREDTLEDALETLPETLQAAGVRTFGVSANRNAVSLFGSRRSVPTGYIPAIGCAELIVLKVLDQ